MIEFTCPHCGNVMRVEDQYAGRSGKCQQCGSSVSVPMGHSMNDSAFGSPPVGPYAQPQAMSRSGSNKPVLCLVFAILGLTCCFPFAIVAVILGHAAMRETMKGESDYTMALIGTIIGYVSIGIIVLGFVVWAFMILLSFALTAV